METGESFVDVYRAMETVVEMIMDTLWSFLENQISSKPLHLAQTGDGSQRPAIVAACNAVCHAVFTLHSLSSYGHRAFAVADPDAWNSLISLISVIRHLALTVSDVCLKLCCFQSTSTYSALEVSHFMRYINSRLTYLLTTSYCCVAS